MATVSRVAFVNAFSLIGFKISETVSFIGNQFRTGDKENYLSISSIINSDSNLVPVL